MKRTHTHDRFWIFSKTIFRYKFVNDTSLVLLLSVPFLVLVWQYLTTEYRAIGDIVFVIDDSWIHLEFAKNIAWGNGFSFNPHEPIAASTAPLYTILVAGLYLISPDHITSLIYMMTIMLTMGTIGLTYSITKHVTNSLLFSVLTALSISLNPWLTWSALSGMEISVGMFLLVFAIWSYVTKNSQTTWRRFLPAFLFALVTLVRPESYSFLLAYMLFEVIRMAYLRFRNRLTSIEMVKNLGLLTVVILVVILPYGLFSLATAGSFFPNTYAAKVGNLGLAGMLTSTDSVASIYRSISAMVSTYFKHYFSELLTIHPWVRWMYIVMLPVYGYEAYKRKKLRILVLPTICLIFPLMVGMMVPEDRISWPWNRHMLYLVPTVVLTSFIGTFFLYFRLKRIPMAGTIVVALIMVTTIVSLQKSIPEVRQFFIDRTVSMKQNHIALAEWVRHTIPPEAVVAASDIGVIGYYTDNYIVDTEGLINPRISAFSQRRNSELKDAEVLAYLTEKKPDYLIKFDWVYPSFQPADFRLIHSSTSLGVYTTPWTRYRINGSGTYTEF
ncbi:hypothetical protein HY469_04540 [Candidatus Roizmanbacteria bacterium]|nr:hypothetical protein [Candidatus Roizmanbacteria bacterium]